MFGQTQRRTRHKARVTTIPAPTGGWNARDTLSAMGKKDAVILENLVVVPGGIMTRPGQQTHATGLGTYIETLMEHAPASGLGKLFAATPTSIFDASASGAVGAAVQTGKTNGRWQHANFATPGGDYLYMVNGADAPLHYDGTTWVNPTITGTSLAPSDFICVLPHMNRLFFIEKSSLNVWYLGLQSIAGAATKFSLEALASFGGELVAIASWTRDGGAGTDDAFVAITSKGQVFVYVGTDPATAATWSLQGVYQIPEPLGRRCTYKLGAELIVLTRQGPLPMSKVAGLSQASQTNLSITDKISGAFSAAADRTGDSFGWQIIESTRHNLLFINVPEAERVAQSQYVFGTRTGAWAPFKGWNAGCFGLYRGELYWGDNAGSVHKVTGTTDDGMPIIQTYLHAFSDLGTPMVKRPTMARPRLYGPAGFTPIVQIKTDYDTSRPTTSVLLAEAEGAEWDIGEWDEAMWGAESMSTQAWQSVVGIGSAVSVAFQWSSTTPVMLNGTDVAFEVGGML